MRSDEKQKSKYSNISEIYGTKKDSVIDKSQKSNQKYFINNKKSQESNESNKYLSPSTKEKGKKEKAFVKQQSKHLSMKTISKNNIFQSANS